MTVLITFNEAKALCAARAAGTGQLQCSLDLGRTLTQVEVSEEAWYWQDQRFPYLETCKDRTIYYWTNGAFEPISRYTDALIKLVPTAWGPPTFEIDGIKMLPTAQTSPYTDAQRKVALIEPRGKRILDCCGGLGYFADCCVQAGAAQVISYEKNPDVLWLREINPWSPRPDEILGLTVGAIEDEITALADASVDAVLHDPPRFGIAGELYSLRFYEQLARVLRPKGKLFHYTGTPNKLTSRRDVPNEVAQRLRRAGFDTELMGDGVFAVKR